MIMQMFFTVSYDQTNEQTELENRRLRFLNDEEKEIVLLSVVAGFKSKKRLQNKRINSRQRPL